MAKIAGGHRLAPGQGRADGPAPAVEEDGGDTGEADQESADEGDQGTRDSS